MWAIDLGTTNSALAHWDSSVDRPRLFAKPGARRKALTEHDRLELPAVVPSALRIRQQVPLLTRLSNWGPGRRWAWGEPADIGQAALDLNERGLHAGFVTGFKRALMRAPLRPLAAVAGRSYDARDATWLFLRELIKSAREFGVNLTDTLTLTAPVEAFESYRAELQGVARRLGLRAVKFLDEPVAAAIGYGLTLERRRRVLVVDFGGGTLDLAVVNLDPRSAERGLCEVVAKAGAAIGGDLVDQWLLDALWNRLGYGSSSESDHPAGGAFPAGALGAESQVWRQLLLGEARRIKEAVFFDEQTTFDLLPPEELRLFEARLRRDPLDLTVTRGEVLGILEERGLYRCLDRLLNEVGAQGAAAGVGLDDVDDVLMVGGSTLLPGVFSFVERRFGRDRVRSFQPFEAVAFGACCFAAGRMRQADFVVHDYALLTHDARGEAQYTTIIERGTRIPTAPDHWKRQLVPTCALGAPERFFKLIVCEVAQAGPERTFGFDEDGRVHKLGGTALGARRASPAAAEEPLIVPLNQSNPTIGELDPPHLASDRRARLEVSFGVNAERWLCATVLDLKTQKALARERPVVRLL